MDFSEVLSNLVNGTRPVAGRKACPLWRPEHKAYLKSAIVGGQWPQARLAKVPGWTDDPRCQLCEAAIGTLEHRHKCPVTQPSEGWPQGTKQAQDFLASLSSERRSLLSTRGLLLTPIRVPHRATHDTLEWIMPFSGPRTPADPDLTWVVDGSLYDEARRFARRTGFGIVVIDPDGNLIACARGKPPRWIRDAAGAESWAVQTVTALTLSTPWLVTDCKGIIDAIAGTPDATVTPHKMLARTWRQICANLDWDFTEARERMVWMPSHEAIT